MTSFTAAFEGEAIALGFMSGAGFVTVGVLGLLAARIARSGCIAEQDFTIGIAFTVSLLVGLVFGVLPASRAARWNPTEALRYE